jgi:heptose I phosphotransferase
VPWRWRVKDLGGLCFSAMGAGLTRSDRYRFVAAYAGRPLREALAGPGGGLWRAVERRARRLAARHVFEQGVPAARRRRAS